MGTGICFKSRSAAAVSRSAERVAIELAGALEARTDRPIAAGHT
jgi:hypothetical protein